MTLVGALLPLAVVVVTLDFIGAWPNPCIGSPTFAGMPYFVKSTSFVAGDVGDLGEMGDTGDIGDVGEVGGVGFISIDDVNIVGDLGPVATGCETGLC